MCLMSRGENKKPELGSKMTKKKLRIFFPLITEKSVVEGRGSGFVVQDANTKYGSGYETGSEE